MPASEQKSKITPADIEGKLRALQGEVQGKVVSEGRPRLVDYLSTRGFRDGLLRGRSLWTALGVIIWSARLLKKMATRKPQVVAREVLRPGQSITISALSPDESPRTP